MAGPTVHPTGTLVILLCVEAAFIASHFLPACSHRYGLDGSMTKKELGFGAAFMALLIPIAWPMIASNICMLCAPFAIFSLNDATKSRIRTLVRIYVLGACSPFVLFLPMLYVHVRAFYVGFYVWWGSLIAMAVLFLWLGSKIGAE